MEATSFEMASCLLGRDEEAEHARNVTKGNTLPRVSGARDDDKR